MHKQTLHAYCTTPVSSFLLFFEEKTPEKGPEEMMKTHRMCTSCFSVLGAKPDIGHSLSWHIPADTSGLNKAFVPSWWADAPNLPHLVLSRQIGELELQILYGPIFHDLLDGSADGHA